MKLMIKYLCLEICFDKDMGLYIYWIDFNYFLCYLFYVFIIDILLY